MTNAREHYQHTFPWEISKIPKFNLTLTTENSPKTIHQVKNIAKTEGPVLP
jgi:hypothetical protein